jgi:hypothetical protein
MLRLNLQKWRTRGGQASVAVGAIVLAGLLTMVPVVATLMAPRLQADLVASSMVSDGGFAYVAPIPIRQPFGFRLATDNNDLKASVLQIMEDGRLLGPAHSSRDDIRQRGNGRYSHWDIQVYFSTSDSTDPRTNGRRYSIATQVSLRQLVWLAVGLIDALALIVAWPWLVAHQQFLRRAFPVAGAIGALLAFVAAVGAFGRINEASGEPKDGALVIAVLLHAMLGVALLLAQWAAGAGLARLLLGAQRATFANVLVLGFMMSLPIAAILSAAAIVLPFGPMLAAASWLLCCSPIWFWRSQDTDWVGVARGLAVMLPLSLAFGCWMGLLWHGPTETLSGLPSGDPVYYSALITSLSGQFYPFRDLGYVYGAPFTYLSMLFPMLGAAIGKVASLDPLLFIVASGASTFVLAVGLMLQLYMSGTGILFNAHSRSIVAITVALTIISANRFPYWVVGSVPVAHAVPLTIGVAFWVRKTDSFAWLIGVSFAIIGSLLSKVVSLAVLVPFAAAPLVNNLLRLSRTYLVAAFLVTAAAAAVAALLLYKYASFFVVLAPPGPESLTMPWNRYTLMAVLPLFMREMSAVLLAGIAFLLTDWLRASAIAFGFLLFLVYPFFIYFDFICAILLFGLVACDDVERLRKYRVLVLGALALALPAALLTDLAGISSGVIWLLCVGGVTWAAMPREPSLMSRALVRIVPATLALLCIGLIGVARGNLILSSGWGPVVLTPAVREVWLAARDRTPADALIFTDQTGLEPTLLEGWNTYAIIGGRQIFASSIYTNPETRLNRVRAMEVLAENDAVLEGRLPPGQLKLPGKYSAFYAVVSCARSVPPSWPRVFGNQTYCLYQMTGGR